MNLKAVLFDMDGVLFDLMKNHTIAWNEAMKRYGMNLSCEEAYMHEGRTGTLTVNIVSTRKRHRGSDTGRNWKDIPDQKRDFQLTAGSGPYAGNLRISAESKGVRTDSDGSDRLGTKIIAGKAEP